MTAPLLQLRSYQSPPFWRDDLGMLILLWRRQAGKTRTLSGKALRRMMELPGLLVTYASCSLNVGAEFVVKEAGLWTEAIDLYRKAAEQFDKRITTTADGVDFDGLCDLLEHNRLEVRLHHSNTVYSRTHVIAPNIATARSWTGDVFLDEFGFIRDFRGLFEAMEPIMSSDPSFRCLAATTPPADDTHYSYELTVPPEGVEFTPETADPTGHWYVSQAGFAVHRADAWDVHAAGIPLYDLNTREPLTPEQHRERHHDRDAWDRNYWLKHITGGTAAVSLVSARAAQERGRTVPCLAAEDDFPPDWRSVLGPGKIAIGADPATTEKEKSNPFALAVVEEAFPDYILRLVLRFKTADPEKAKAYLADACDLGHGRRPHRLVIDATSERFWAAEVRRAMLPICPVTLVVNSEKVLYQGQPMTYKSYLGNLLVNAMDDQHWIMPEVVWLKEDYRLVMRKGGSFDNRLDSAGHHGDCFDASKNALFGLVSKGGRPEATALQVGTYASPVRDPADDPRRTLVAPPDAALKRSRSWLSMV